MSGIASAEAAIVNTLWSTESSQYGCFYNNAGVELPLPGRRLKCLEAKTQKSVDGREEKTISVAQARPSQEITLEALARDIGDAKKDIDVIKGILLAATDGVVEAQDDGHEEAIAQIPADPNPRRPPRPTGPTARYRRAPSVPPQFPYGERVLIDLAEATRQEASRCLHAASVTANDKELAPADDRYSYYKYYGYGGRGARTSWAHNNPLGAPPLPLPDGADPHLDAKDKQEVREFWGPATQASINHAKLAAGFGPLGGSVKSRGRNGSVLFRILSERPSRMAASQGALDKYAGKRSSWGPMANPRVGTA